MDVNRLSTGEKLAGAAGIVLLLIMFIFDWFTVDAGGGFSFGGNAWEVFQVIDLVLFVTAVAAIALAVVAASQSRVDLPVALSAIVTGLGILSVLLVLFRIISPPDGGAGDLIDVGRGIGVFLGLIAAGGIAAGGWLAMQEEGTSFGAQADRAQDRPAGGGERRETAAPGQPATPAEPGDRGSAPPPPPPSGTSNRPGGPAA